MCQSSGYASCKSMLKGGCEAECDSPEGAIFCDGNYVDHGGNAQECIDAIRAAVNITVDTSARGSYNAECSGGTCMAEAEGEASASCSTPKSAPSGGGAGLLAFAAAIGAVLTRRKSRSS
jgi:uncharacterized protein (TIGR03382 family)